MTTVAAAIGLGGNVGDVERTLRQATDALAAIAGITHLRVSRWRRTAAWGMPDQPDFLNGVACVRTTLPAPALLEVLLDIERVHGRDRTRERRWGPRTLDLDLLLYGDAVIDRPGLTVPHPHLHERAFVLEPLLEVWPDAVIPGIGPARQAWDALPG